MTNEENNAAQGWIVFDQVEVDLSGRRLFVAGADMPLEPKAFAVLVLLARQPGRAFGRDEILDAVWGHRHVTPGVLNRVITLLRQALGESAHESQYLHTLHGVGYRFDAAVRFTATRATGSSDAAANVTPATAISRADAAIDDVPAQAMPQSVDVQSDGADVVQIAPAPPSHNPRSTFRPRTIYLAATALLVLVAVVLWRAQTPDTAHAPSATTPAAVVNAAAPRSLSLIVLPLRAIGGSHEEATLADGLSEELTTQLAGAEGLRLISSTSARLAQTQNLDPAQLAQRTGTTHALEGSLRQSGNALRIDLRLIATPSGQTLWAQDFDRNLGDVFALERDIAHAVATTLNLKLGLDSLAGAVDPAVLHEYLEIRKELYYPSLNSSGDVRTRLRTLVARAPEFAPAHGLLANVLAGTGVSTREELGEAQREATRALELDPRQVDARMAQSQLGCLEQNWSVCLDTLEQVLQLDPTYTWARVARTRWLANLGYVDAALGEGDTAAVSDPLVYYPHLYRACVLDSLGRHDDAGRVLDAAATLGPAVPQRVVAARWFNAVWRGDLVAARAFAQAMRPEDDFRESSIAIVDALADPSRLPQARSAIEASEQKTGRPNFSRMLLPDAAADAAKVIGAIEVSLHSLASSFSMALWNPENASLRRTPAFQDFLKRNHMLDYWRAHGWPPQCKPEGDGARCE